MANDQPTRTAQGKATEETYREKSTRLCNGMIIKATAISGRVGQSRRTIPNNHTMARPQAASPKMPRSANNSKGRQWA